MAQRSVWQNIFRWWKSDLETEPDPPGGPASFAGGTGGKASGERWQKRTLTVDAAPSPVPGLDTDEPTEAELREFLAADTDPVDADPEFKRKLREQLWAMLEENELTRQ